jgi:hypothetical protein
MSDASIIDNNVDEVDVLSEYFEVVDEDIYYTFKHGGHLKGGINNILYGSRENISELYRRMVSDVSDYVMSDEFLDKFKHCGSSIGEKINIYTTNRYGISYEWVYNKVNDTEVGLSTDIIFEDMMRYKGGVEKVDWMRLYDRIQIITNIDAILIYIANELLKSSMYKYFVDRYKLRIVGVKNAFNVSNNYKKKLIILRWDDDKGVCVDRLITLAQLPRNKREWWQTSTYTSNKNRTSIQDYDLLLNGRCENEVLPDVCPIDNNIVLNYTGIDFSVNTNHNITECKNHNDTTDDGDKTWSFASIDRIDSTKEYDYDNVEIISHYYNSQVKNCASNSQIGKLYYYQLKKLLNKKINKELVKSMSDDELYKVSDMFGVYFKLFEIISDNNTILHKEMVRRDKKSKLVVKI